MPYRFPEVHYPPPAHRRVEYARRVEAGRALMARSSVVVCGLARDLGEGALVAVAAVEAIGGLFADWRAVIYENDSADATARVLADWGAGHPGRVTVVSESLGWPRWPPVRDGDRCNQMAHYRERLRALVVDRHGACDYAVVVDLDIGRYSLEGLASSFGWRDDLAWGAMASNGLAQSRRGVIQYDAFAWRDLGHPRPMRARDVNPRVLTRGEPPLPVLSAFGGMAAYPLASLRQSRYAPDGDCEHVAFHARIPRVFVNPSQVVLY